MDYNGIISFVDLYTTIFILLNQSFNSGIHGNMENRDYFDKFTYLKLEPAVFYFGL